MDISVFQNLHSTCKEKYVYHQKKQWQFNNVAILKGFTLVVKRKFLEYADSVYGLCISHTCITDNFLLSNPSSGTLRYNASIVSGASIVQNLR